MQSYTFLKELQNFSCFFYLKCCIFYTFLHICHSSINLLTKKRRVKLNHANVFQTGIVEFYHTLLRLGHNFYRVFATLTVNHSCGKVKKAPAIHQRNHRSVMFSYFPTEIMDYLPMLLSASSKVLAFALSGSA